MTVVLDASAMAEMLDPGSSLAILVIDALTSADSDWAVPEHFRVEVANALRGLLLSGRLTREAFDDSIDRLARADVEVHATAPLLVRIAALAANATAYDAAYIALAETVGATVLTTDAKLERVPGIRCEVRTIG